MKAFKNWEKKLPIYDREYRTPDFYEGIERGWRAALEWALEGEENYCSFRQCVTADRVEEELDGI